MQMGIQLQMQNQMWMPIQTQIQARTHMRSNPDPNVEPNPNTANPDPNPDLSPDPAYGPRCPVVPGDLTLPCSTRCPVPPAPGVPTTHNPAAPIRHPVPRPAAP